MSAGALGSVGMVTLFITVLSLMGTIEEAGRLCLYLAADATFTTGVDHILSGGAELAYGRKTRR